MANQVFANGMEVSCKAADGKSVACFPDVCFTPPQTPATPPGVPIPYPNTGLAKDTTKGSRSVKISGKEVMLKNKSHFKTSYGDEPGCAPKKGVLTSKNKGKVYFQKWSMNVKVEGENAVRMMDLTTHNHGANPGNTPPWMYLDDMSAPPPEHPCKEDIEKAQKSCGKTKVVDEKRDCKGTTCEKDMECILVPKGKDKQMCCSPDNTGHHLIEDHWIRPGGTLLPDFAHLAEKEDNGQYKKKYGPYDGAPTMCVNRSRYSGKHGIAHGTGGVMEAEFIGKEFTYGDAKKIALESHADANPGADCKKGCIESQIDGFYGKDGKKKCHSPDRKQPLKSSRELTLKTDS